MYTTHALTVNEILALESPGRIEFRDYNSIFFFCSFKQYLFEKHKEIEETQNLKLRNQIL